VRWNLSHRCRTEEALDAVEQAVLQRLPARLGRPRRSWSMFLSNISNNWFVERPVTPSLSET
jgi:hypothetical protein